MSTASLKFSWESKTLKLLQQNLSDLPGVMKSMKKSVREKWRTQNTVDVTNLPSKICVIRML